MASSAPVTLCMRNLPCKILEADLSETITAMRLDASRYTFYLPKKPGRKGRMNNFGYGFVTCSQQQDACNFARLFQGYQFTNVWSAKRMLVEPTFENRPIGPFRSRNDADHTPNSGSAHSLGLGDAQGTDNMDEAKYWVAANANGGTAPPLSAVCEYYMCTKSPDPPSTSLGEQGRAPPRGNEVPHTRLAAFDLALQYQ
eukprot:TRINITY_DN6785_c0_g1_i1.p1 TRINITY_DN6785_c0_g1~~TRINITY_DN6785_c0_g1_i1.p1  ORF type:complete len:199 (-),score=13.58 TRINITY_DN6785_c0_g1_i1:392-988(-)